MRVASDVSAKISNYRYFAQTC